MMLTLQYYDSSLMNSKHTSHDNENMLVFDNFHLQTAYMQNKLDYITYKTMFCYVSLLL
jgi:hypothetical protein